MRELADRSRLETFMRRFGAAAPKDGVCLLTGGATAVLVGWRAATIDVDLALVPEQDALLRAIPELKRELEINVELVAADDFVPLPEGAEGRSIFVAREGKLTFRHVDPYAQALSKLERGHARDLEDVAALAGHGLIEPDTLLELFAGIVPQLYRYPAVDPPSFRRAVERAAEAMRAERL